MPARQLLENTKRNALVYRVLPVRDFRTNRISSRPFRFGRQSVLRSSSSGREYKSISGTALGGSVIDARYDLFIRLRRTDDDVPIERRESIAELSLKAGGRTVFEFFVRSRNDYHVRKCPAERLYAYHAPRRHVRESKSSSDFRNKRKSELFANFFVQKNGHPVFHTFDRIRLLSLYTERVPDSVYTFSRVQRKLYYYCTDVKKNTRART